MSHVAYEWVISLCIWVTMHCVVHMSQSCHVWMTYVTYAWVMSRTIESYHCAYGSLCIVLITWVSHVTYECGLFYRALLQKRPIILSINMGHYALSWSHESVMSRMNELCHVCMSHVTNVWVMSRMKKSYHVCMSHVMYESVMWCMPESCHVWTSHVTYARVMSRMSESCHTWMSHFTHAYVACRWVTVHRLDRISESRHIWIRTCEWVMSHMNESHRCVDRSRCIARSNEWVTSHMNQHMWMSHVTHERVMLPIKMGHSARLDHMSESRHIWISTCEWVMSHMNESCPYEDWSRCIV